MVDRGCLNFSTNLSFVDERVLAQAPVDSMKPLPDTFVPSNYDVICGKSKSCYNHIGNRRFRITIDLNLHKYAMARSKLEKSIIIMSIVDIVRENSPSGGFVKHDRRTGQWYSVSDQLAREKVGSSLRDALSQRQRQSFHKDDSIKSKKPVQRTSSRAIVNTRPRPRLSFSSLDAFVLGIDFQSETVDVETKGVDLNNDQ